jgi:hypothetical protein
MADAPKPLDPNDPDDPRNDPVQKAAKTEEGKRIESLALTLLGQVLRRSVMGERIDHGRRSGEPREWGGVIYVWEETAKGPGGHKKGALGSTKPIMGYSATNADLHQWELNFGCPEGSRPVAWYHTHPVKNFIGHGGDPFSTHSREFIGGDLKVSAHYMIPGYVATSDGKFWRYDPQVAKDDNGNVLLFDSQHNVVKSGGRPVFDESKKGAYGVIGGILIPGGILPL